MNRINAPKPTHSQIECSIMFMIKLTIALAFTHKQPHSRASFVISREVEPQRKEGITKRSTCHLAFARITLILIAIYPLIMCKIFCRLI
jgi:hypothetical protein